MNRVTRAHERPTLVMVGFGRTGLGSVLQLISEPTMSLLAGRALGLLGGWDVRDRYVCSS
jgi:hypothetical protein